MHHNNCLFASVITQALYQHICQPVVTQPSLCFPEGLAKTAQGHPHVFTQAVLFNQPTPPTNHEVHHTSPESHFLHMHGTNVFTQVHVIQKGSCQCFFSVGPRSTRSQLCDATDLSQGLLMCLKIWSNIIFD